MSAAMMCLFDSQEEAPKLNPVELEGNAALECFRTLRAAWLAGDEMALEVTK